MRIPHTEPDEEPAEPGGPAAPPLPGRKARAGIALEKAVQYLIWLVPVLEKFLRSQKFLLGDRLQGLALRVVEELVLRADVYRFFPSIDHAVLKADLRRRIACARTLRLLDLIVDGSNPQEPVWRYFPGDDLFAPGARRRGLPLGNLTSQLFGNLVLDPLDHHVKEVLRVRGYVRYLDDFALFGHSEEELAQLRREVQRCLDRRRLLLHPRKTEVCRCDAALSFLGFDLQPEGRRALPAANVQRARTRIAHLRQAWRKGSIDEAAVRQRIGGWVAHARHADTWRLRCRMFPRGWFHPQGEPARPK